MERNKFQFINQRCAWLATGLLVMASSYAVAYDAHGPWTKVDQIYSKVGNGRPFVYFRENAMPGCYGNRGAYLPIDEVDRSNKIHSVLLAALLADRDIQVFYNYESVTEDYAGWGLCTIEAVYIR